jgi:hypothetical protein
MLLAVIADVPATVPAHPLQECTARSPLGVHLDLIPFLWQNPVPKFWLILIVYFSRTRLHHIMLQKYV